MGKAILIILLSSALMYSIVSLNTNKILEQATSKSIEHHNQIRARNIANSMVQMVISDLSEDDSYRVNSPQTKDLLDGTVSYTIKDTNFAGEDLIQIIAESEYSGFTKKVVAYTELNAGGAEELPPLFMQYAILMEEHLKLSGNSRVEDDGNPLWNANIHVNGKFEISGGAVEGFVTYVEEAKGDLELIVPNQNPDGDPPVSQISPIDIPIFDPADWIGLADDYYPDHHDFEEPVVLGTKDNPKIIYVDGDVRLKEGAVVTGYGALIVNGSTTVSGGVSIIPADPNQSSFALYSVGKVVVSGTSFFKGQIFALDHVTFSGGSQLYGSITTKGKVTISGGGNLYYKPAGANLTSPFWEGEEGSGGGRMKVVYYNE